VKAKAFFERLYLVPGLRKIAPFVTSPSAPTSPPLALRLFLDFHFFPKWPLNFFWSARQVIWPSLGTASEVKVAIFPERDSAAATWS